MPTTKPKLRSRHLEASTCYRLPEPKDPRTGRRRPHVPSSKTNNVKEHEANTKPAKRPGNRLRRTVKPDNQPSPAFQVGDLDVRHVGDQSVEPPSGVVPSGEAAYMGHLRFGQHSISKKVHEEGRMAIFRRFQSLSAGKFP
jgi:hypothetical protein